MQQNKRINCYFFQVPNENLVWIRDCGRDGVWIFMTQQKQNLCTTTDSPFQAIYVPQSYFFILFQKLGEISLGNYNDIDRHWTGNYRKTGCSTYFGRNHNVFSSFEFWIRDNRGLIFIMRQKDPLQRKSQNIQYNWNDVIALKWSEIWWRTWLFHLNLSLFQTWIHIIFQN